ncbi:MAG: PD40 domain-containing protein [Chloroflexi bacterium]|nr:PD40 domain-containing protein [Chloroflexota bacterium]
MRAARWLPLVVLSFPVACMAPPTRVPSPEPTSLPASANGRLAFQSNAEGNWEIYSLDISTGTVLNLTQHPAEDRAPAWSPDGKQLAFESNRDGNWEIYTLDLETQRAQRLTQNPHFEGAPAWSPDGQRLAFESYRDGNLEIYLLDLESNALRRLTQDPAGDYSPRWSPDGEKITFVSWRDGDKEIYVLHLTTMALQRLTQDAADDEDPAWSPDGQRLAFVSWRDGTAEIYGMPAAGGNPVRLTDNDVADRSPAWTSDGDLIFATYHKGEPFEMFHEYRYGHWDLAWLDPLSPGKGRPLLDSLADDRRPAPSPDLAGVPARAQSMGTPTLRIAATRGDSGLNSQGHLPPAGDPPWRLVSIYEGDPGSPFRLHENAARAFFALREAVRQRSGWDYLARLSDAFRPLSLQRTRYGYFSWHKTGRAIDLRFELMGPDGNNQLQYVREDIGNETYWRIYIRAARQDGSLGEPLKVAPWRFWWNIDSRADPEGYKAGGRTMSIPEGYYVDFTELAERYGWERIASYNTKDYSWCWDTLGTEFWHYQYMEGLRWYEAIAQIYPPEVLAERFSWSVGLDKAFPEELLRRKGIPPPP